MINLKAQTKAHAKVHGKVYVAGTLAYLIPHLSVLITDLHLSSEVTTIVTSTLVMLGTWSVKNS